MREPMPKWQAYLVLWLWEAYLSALQEGNLTRIHGMRLAWSQAFNDLHR